MSSSLSSTLPLGLGGVATAAGSSGPMQAAGPGPTRRTLRPITTGTSVLGIRYAGGVMMAADTLLSYGTLAKFKDAHRLVKVNSNTLMGGSGEFSDFQLLVDHLKAKALEDVCTADSLYANEDSSKEDSAQQVWSYLRAVMYNRRSRFNPLWNELLIAGLSDGKDKRPFLGCVDKIGTAYEDDILATGYGAYIAVPLMREKYRPDLEEGEARALLEDCMRILFYRDARALNRIQIAKVTAEEGVLVSDPYELETNWDSTVSVPTPTDLEGDGGW